MKRIILSVIIFLLSVSLGAIGFGYHVFDIRTEPEFAEGIFPTSVKYQFNFPVPDLIENCKTEFAFRLDNGLVYRTLRQDPVTGEYYAENPSLYDFPHEYTVHFDEFNLFFAQGFVDTSFSDNDLITLFFSIDGRFEMAFERLSWMKSESETAGVFWDKHGNYRFPSDSFLPGAPELSDDRSMFQTSLTFGLKFDYMRDSVTRRDGIRGGSYFRYAPPWMLLTDGSGDFALWWNEIEASYTLFDEPMATDEGLSWFSIVLDDKLVYRFISGEKVPQYAAGGEMWGPDVPMSQHAITNRLSITFYGPQIKSRDTYPSITIFWDLGWGLGKRLNSVEPVRISESVGSYGIRCCFVIVGIAEFYYEIGCSYDPVFNEDPYVEQKFGFSVGI